MQRVAADCQRTESSIAIITCASSNHLSYAAFYTDATRDLYRDWWDIDPDTTAEIDGHAGDFSRSVIQPAELQRVAESLLKITPIPNFVFPPIAITEAFNIRNEWNFREYGWIGDAEYGLLAWETSA